MDQQYSQYNPRSTRDKLRPKFKLLISFVISLIWSLLTHGRPSSPNLQQQFTHVDTTLQHIFQTTIAIQRKRFTKRIIQHSQGYWSLIPYVNQPRWIDLEIYLTTRIGFDLREGTASINQYGKIEVNVIEPTVLDKTWSTEIIDKSDNLLNKWDIRQYKQKENQVLEAIAYAESMNLLEQFKNSPEKMSDLSKRLEHKLELTDSILDRPMQWIDGINAMVKNKLVEFSRSITKRPEPKVYHANDYRTKQKPRQVKQTNDKPSSQRREPKKGREPKNAVYTQQELRIRKQMRDTLNL